MNLLLKLTHTHANPPTDTHTHTLLCSLHLDHKQPLLSTHEDLLFSGSQNL